LNGWIEKKCKKFTLNISLASSTAGLSSRKRLVEKLLPLSPPLPLHSNKCDYVTLIVGFSKLVSVVHSVMKNDSESVSMECHVVDCIQHLSMTLVKDFLRKYKPKSDTRPFSGKKNKTTDNTTSIKSKYSTMTYLERH
jgi:hypothetical protein